MGVAGWLGQPAALPWVALALGLCIGSFLNVVIHRLPKMMEREWFSDIGSAVTDSIHFRNDTEAKHLVGALDQHVSNTFKEPLGLASPRSRCPTCGHQIGVLENIPLISYLVLRGKCSKCAGRIGVRYPIVELLAGVAAWYAAARFGPTILAAATMVFVWMTIALAVIDQDTGLLPDDLTIPLLWLGLLVNLGGTFVPLNEAVIGAAAGYMSLWTINAGFKLIRGVDGLGYGDFKMTAAVGAFLGWKSLFLLIFLSAILGSIFGIAQMLAARRGWDGMFKFHFGPYIAMSAILVMFWGKEIAMRVPAFNIF